LFLLLTLIMFTTTSHTYHLNKGSKSNEYSSSSIPTNTNSNLNTNNYGVDYKTDLFAAKLEKCNQLNCQDKYGKCFDNTTCICNYGFADINLNLRLSSGSVQQNSLFSQSQNSMVYAFPEQFHPEQNTHFRCSYIQKRSIIALILEVVFPIGIGHLYCFNFLYFFIKFSIALLLPLIYFLAKQIKPSFFSKTSDESFSVVWMLLFGIAFIVDIYGYSSGKYRDGNDVPLLVF